MADWLAAVAGQMSEGEVDDHVYLVSMPLGTPIPSGLEGAIAPVGHFSRDWLRETAGATGRELLARAGSFFPWWEPGVHAQARTGIGRTALWRFPWHSPRDEEESALAKVALSCLGASPSNLGPGGALSRRDIDELAGCLAVDPDASVVPAPTGFGFMRGNVKKNPFPGCTLEVPGYFYEDDDAEDRAKILWFGDRVVRIVSWLVSSGGQSASSARELVEGSTASAPGRGQPASRFAIDAPPLSGYCVVLDPAEGESSRHAHAVLERPGRMLLLTITFASPADSAWVESVVRSVALEAPEGN